MNELERIARLSPEKRALLIEKLKARASAEARGSIPRRGNLGSFPMSYAQQRLWFLDQFEPDSGLYNVPAALSIQGPFDVVALEKSLNKIIQRHEVLRATFTVENGQPVQHITPELVLSLPVQDLSSWGAADARDQVMRLAAEEARRPFDLSQGPLVRAQILRLAAEQHVFLFTVHHIVYDGWSTQVLVREMAALYDALSQGHSAALPTLPIQYADYAAWQREELQKPAFADQLAYWKDRLGGHPLILELPADRPRPAAQTFHGSHYTFDLGNLLPRLQELGRSRDATLFMVLLASFQALLYRYTGQPDFIVGTPVANRSRVEVEGLIGFFVNTLPVRVDLHPEANFRALLDTVRQTVLDAFAHQDIPFEMLVEVLQPERELSHAPLVQVMFELHESSLGSLRFGNAQASLLQVETGVSKFDLMLMVEKEGDRLSAALEYNTDLFRPSTIERMVTHWQRLLAGVVANPDCPLWRLPLLDAEERQAILVDWNRTAMTADLDQCIHHLIERQARCTPDAVALVYEDQPGTAQTMFLTYAGLDARADQLAGYLTTLGVGPETIVAVCMERTPEMVVGMLAILKAGGAYLPVDPNYPAERQAFMLQDAGVAVVLTTARTLAQNPLHEQGHARIVCLDTDWAEIVDRGGRAAGVNVNRCAMARDLAYVLFTSGSTGRPKGVAIEHRSAVAFIHWAQRIFDSAVLRGVLASTSISFDLSVFELFFTLSSGGTAILVENALQLAHLASAAAVTLINTVPSAINELLHMEAIPETVQVVNLAGEPLRAEVVDRLYERLPAAQVFDLYGPSEDTTYSTFAQRRAGGPEIIGRPVDNTQSYVLDGYLEPVPVGISGELYLAGAGLARGYLNRPGLTAERFLPDPFGGYPAQSGIGGGRLYKTGDLVRYGEDGNIEFLGRSDHQVKLRGFRIELGEIESHLRSYPGVQDVVLLVREDEIGDRRLVAYMVFSPEEVPAGISELRAFLKSRVPEYMIPSAFVSLGAMPLTPNGKVDRRALPAPEQVRPDLESRYVAPRNPLEQYLAQKWQEILRLDIVGVHDNFFELGGNSIQAAVLVNRIREKLDIQMQVKTVFVAPTIADLAALLADSYPEAVTHLGVTDKPGLQAIRPVPRDADLSLSFAQQRLWFLDQLEPDSSLYNLSFALRLSGTLDVDALRRSFNELACRHETLRTRFKTVDGRAVQEIAPATGEGAVEIPLPVIDLRNTPAGEQSAKLEEILRREACRPFNLATGPLLRLILVRLEPQEHVIAIAVHHIIADGWSIDVLVREIRVLYGAFLHRQPWSLPQLPIQYADYAHWQRQWLQGEVLESQLNYWRQELEGAPPLLELPTDRPRPAIQGDRGALLSFRLPPNLLSMLKTLGHETDTTLFMLLLAAFQTLLYRYSGQADICVGTPIAGRNRVELEELIGFFVNTLVIRTRFADILNGEARQPSFRQVLEQVRIKALDAYAHQDLPFEMLVDELQVSRDLSRSPLFQVMFAQENTPLQPVELEGLTLEPVDLDMGISKFDLTLFVTEQGDYLSCTFEYNTDLFDAKTVGRMAGHLQTLLTAAAADPDCPVSRLPLLTLAEQEELSAWNQTQTPFADDRTLHQLFEAQAAQTPDAPAVVFEGQVLTYGELNRRANQLAHYLRDLGVCPEMLVGICMDRSLDMIVGMLGILKAGGAYVPMDPAYPPDRRSYMMQDTGMQVLLTQSMADVLRVDIQPVRVVCLDEEWPMIARQPAPNPASGVLADHLAYVIFTSGSTGRPKGTLLQHRGACNLAAQYSHDLGICSGSRMLQFFSFSFDGSVMDIFPTLLAGATVCLPRRDALLSMTDLHRLMQEQEVTHALMPPSVLNILPADGLPALEHLLSGGEACNRGIVERWAPGRRFYNAYGPTEITVASSWYEVCELPEGTTSIPIGRPIGNTRYYVLDQRLEPVPVSVPGELCIGGAGVARGYLNRPRLTAERFLPEPAGTEAGARLYRTGDLVRFLPDGNVEYLGRADTQVKIRGFRIELGEVEIALSKHPAVREVAVLAREDTPGLKRLVAYVVLDPATGATVGNLRDHLRELLPEYMIPSAFVLLDALPLTPNSKLDRRALPAPEVERSALESSYLAPRTPQELVLAEIWAQILGLDQVGIEDNFFELGGDSILSIQVVARANQAGLKMTPRQLFEHPTVAGLAAVAGEAPTVQAEQGLVLGTAPLTAIEQWFVEQNLPQRQHWNQAVLLAVQHRLDSALLETTVRHLLRHHDALRLSLQQTAEGWQQTILEPDAAVPFAVIDLQAVPDSEIGRRIEMICAETQASLNLATGPIMQVVYMDLGVDRPGRLLIVVHHLAIDSVSWRILLEDLWQAYRQLQQNKPIQFALKTTSFQSWARRLVEYAKKSDALDGELEYWLKTLDGRNWALPVDYPGGTNTEASTEVVTISLSRGQTLALLQEVPAAYGTEINDILCTALAQTLTGWLHTDAILVGLESHGREELYADVDLSRTVGWFTAMYPVRLALENASGPGQAIKTIKEQLRHVPQRGIGYGLLRYLRQVQALQKSAEPQVVLNYLGQFDALLGEGTPFQLAAESAEPSRCPNGQRTHLFAISGLVLDGVLRIEWSYSRNMHDRQTVEKLAHIFLECLSALIAHCLSPDAVGYTPSDFSDVELNQDELDQVLAQLGEAT